MNIYLVSQNENDDYDTFDSFVVVAENEEAAKLIHPEGDPLDGNGRWPGRYYGSWATSPENVTVKKIGVAGEGFNEGDIICSSFNAG